MKEERDVGGRTQGVEGRGRHTATSWMYTQRKHGDGPSVHGVVVVDNDHRGASRGSSEQFTQMRSITTHTMAKPCLNHAFQDSNIANKGGERGRGQNPNINHAKNFV